MFWVHFKNQIQDNKPLSNWKIYLFGTLTVESPAGQRVALGGTKSAELLAYIALQQGKLQSRTTLVGALWSDTEVSDPRTRLRQETRKLRTLFGEEADQLLSIVTDGVSLAPNVEVDALRFLEAVGKAKSAASPEAAGAFVLHARQLYQGELLPEVSSLWAERERARFGHIYEQMLREYAAACSSQNHIENAVEALQALLKHNPQLEEDHIALMRLFADMGQPAAIQRQYSVLVKALFEAEMEPPTEGTKRLAEQLREQAGKRAYTDNSHKSGDTAVSNVSAEPVIASLDVSVPAPSQLMSRWQTGMFITAIVAMCMAAGWQTIHKSRGIPAAPPPVNSNAARRHQEKWVYHYSPQPSELPNAEGIAITKDPTGIYATGIIDTKNEDTDILTIKLDVNGNEAWAVRYSSPEHDCDRSYSICVDHEHVFVAGHSFVPGKAGAPGGWHLLLLNYKWGSGKQVWAKRSAPLIDDNDHHIQAVADSQGGCFLGGTALVGPGKSTAALVEHYAANGTLLWSKYIRQGKSTQFQKFQLATSLAVCCSVQERSAPTKKPAYDMPLLAILAPVDGKIDRLWLDEQTHLRPASAITMQLDKNSHIYVAGTLASQPESNGHAAAISVKKWQPDGSLEWVKSVAEMGPSVVLTGLSLDTTGNVALCATEYLPDGSEGTWFAHLDWQGNQLKVWPYRAPAGYHSTNITAIQLENSQVISYAGLASPGLATDMVENSSILFGSTGGEGGPGPINVFDAGIAKASRFNDITSSYFPGYVLTGQTALPNKQRAFTVLQY